jgi:hypothetical protein
MAGRKVLACALAGVCSVAGGAFNIADCQTTDAPDPASVTLPPQLQGVRDVYVDALNAVRTKNESKEDRAQRLKFDNGTFVRIVVYNVNPLMFSYSLAHDSGQVVVEASPIDLFKNLLPSFQLPAGGGYKSLFEGGGITKGGGGTPCPADADVVPLTAQVGPITAVGAPRFQLDASLTNDQSVDVNMVKDYRASSNTLFDASQRSATIKSEAMTEAVKLESYIATINTDLLATELLLRSFEQQVNGFNALYDATIKGCANVTSTTKEFAAAAQLRVSGQADTIRFRTLMNTFQSRVGQVYQGLQSLLGVTRDDSRLYATMLLPRYDKATDVQITVRRKPILAPDLGGSSGAASGPSKTPSNAVTVTTTITPSESAPTPMQTPQKAGGSASATTAADSGVFTQFVVHYGGYGRFTLSIGFMTGLLRSPSFAGVPQSVTPTAGVPSDTIRNTLRVTDRSTFRYGPILMLNTRVLPSRTLTGWCCELDVTAGAGVEINGSATNVAYLIGPSVAWLDGHLFTTVGWYVARQTYLLSGAEVGQQVPSGTVPTGSHLKGALGFSVGYRIYQ